MWLHPRKAKSAILFLYRAVLGVEMPWLDDIESAKRPQRLPVVLTRDEVQAIFLHLEGLPGLLVRILYGTGMRILELLRLRVKDVDFVRREILIRDGKGAKDRVTMLPDRVALPVREHLERVQAMHARDLKAGYGSVYLPFALALKYPNASREWAWQYVSPAIRASTDPRTGLVRRHHLDEAGVQKVSKRHCARRASRSRPRLTAFAMHSRPICSNRATIFARCRSYSAIVMWQPR